MVTEPPDTAPTKSQSAQDSPAPPVDAREALLNKIRHLPTTPGVYLFKDGQGRVLYVGKAKDLRSRVSSYFQNSADLLATRGPEIAHMSSLVVDLDFLERETEVDALLQENRLIKDIQGLSLPRALTVSRL